MMKQKFSYLFPRVFPQLSGGPGVTMTPSYELKKVNNKVWGSFRKIWGSKPSKFKERRFQCVFNITIMTILTHSQTTNFGLCKN